jgi:alpha-D-ribose 1-methylphosphonate 5-triphosphate synthase subunit PhnH
VLGDALRFHTGAPLAADRADAAFAYVADPEAMPPLHAFSIGHAQSPQDAATLLIRVDSLSDGPPLQWSGPGIAGACTVRVGGLPPRFWRERAALATQFPCGIDCFLVSGASLVGLPRTTHVEVN